MQSSFPNQGSNLHLLQWKCSLNHWTTRDVPGRFRKRWSGGFSHSYHLTPSLKDAGRSGGHRDGLKPESCPAKFHTFPLRLQGSIRQDKSRMGLKPGCPDALLWGWNESFLVV